MNGTSGVYIRPISSFILHFQAAKMADNNFCPIMNHDPITDRLCVIAFTNVVSVL